MADESYPSLEGDLDSVWATTSCSAPGASYHTMQTPPLTLTQQPWTPSSVPLQPPRMQGATAWPAPAAAAAAASSISELTEQCVLGDDRDVEDNQKTDASLFGNNYSGAQLLLESMETQGHPGNSPTHSQVNSLPGVNSTALPTDGVWPSQDSPRVNMADAARKRKPHFVEDDAGDTPSRDGAKSSRPGVEKFSKNAKQNHSEVEKRRRDRMNTFITELASIIPMCNAMNRKLDKLTVLRMAVQHMRTLQGESQMCTEVSQKPSFLSDEELKHLILKSSEGFLYVISCDRGRILYVSESVCKVLQYNQSELIGQSVFDYLHPKDIAKVKEQLMCSDLSPRDRFIDAKTMTPVKTEFPRSQTRLCSGARRSFYCRMKKGDKMAAGGDIGLRMNEMGAMMENDSYQRRRKTADKRHFLVVHCTGYIKSWTTASMGLEEDSEADSEACNLSCLAAVAIPQPHFNSQSVSIQENPHINQRPMEFVSRHTVDGKFTYVDQRVTSILGYLPQELLGASLYEYYHNEDLPHLSAIHKKVLQCQQKLETSPYRMKAKDNDFITLKSRMFGFRNPWTKEVEYIISTNTLITYVAKEVPSSCLEPDISTMHLTEATLQTNTSACGSTGSKPTVVMPDLSPDGIRPGAASIGKQIANEAMEAEKEGAAAAIEDIVRASRKQKVEMARALKKTIAATSVAQVVSHKSDLRLSLQHSGISFTLTGTNGMSVSLGPRADDLAGTVRSCGGPHGWEPMSGTESESSGTDGNDEASMAMIMSLLEADAGLGGPVDFSDLPWPL